MPLHWSAVGGRPKVAQFLLDKGAKVDPEDDSRQGQNRRMEQLGEGLLQSLLRF